jgi:high-affinity iron transporter
MGSRPATVSQPVSVSATSARTGTAPVAVKPVTLSELTPPNDLYQKYAAARLNDLTADVATLRRDLAKGDITQAKKDWLTAQQAWERVGASYDSFGGLGVAVDGLAGGLPDGVNDRTSPACTGSSTASGRASPPRSCCRWSPPWPRTSPPRRGT